MVPDPGDQRSSDLDHGDHGLAVTALRRSGRDIDDAVLAHIWPIHHENVHFYGTHSVDVDRELGGYHSRCVKE